MRKTLKYLVLTVFVAAVSMLASGLFLRYAPQALRGDNTLLGAQVPPPNGSPQGEMAVGDDSAGSITLAAERVIPSVVGVSTAIAKERGFFTPSDGETWSMGSGIVVTDKGHILTNHHVISGGRGAIIITTIDGRTTQASAVWSDPALDLAIVKAPDNLGLPVASLGDSSALRIGEAAIAIGNPLSVQFQRTVTAGIVSALNRTIALTENGQVSYMEGLIQTDASINPGNSGGPLVNSKGEVIGINTIKVSSAESMGFAIPINICRPVIASINQTGGFKTPYLGLYAFDKEMALYSGMSFPANSGVYVVEVDTGSPAHNAGIRSGDIILQFAGKNIKTMLDLRTELFYLAPGEEAHMIITRGDKTLSLSAKIAEKANNSSNSE